MSSYFADYFIVETLRFVSLVAIVAHCIEAVRLLPRRFFLNVDALTGESLLDCLDTAIVVFFGFGFAEYAKVDCGE